MWSNLTTNFNQEEETVNFGTRLAVEAKGNLYEVVTFALFESEDSHTSNNIPSSVVSQTASQTIALALDNCLHVIESGDDSSSNQTLSLNFNSNVDVIQWTPCKRFLLVGLSSGDVHLIHVPSEKALPAISLTKALEHEVDCKCYAGCFIKEEVDGAISVHFLSCSGQLFQINNIDFNGLHEAISRNDYSTLKEIQTNMQMQNQIIWENRCSKALSTYDGNFLFTSEDSLAVYRQDKSFETIDFGIAIGKESKINVMKASKTSTNLLFCLTGTGALVIVCLTTMIVLDVWENQNICNFAILEDSHGDCKLLLTVKKEKSASRFLQMKEFQTSEILYELEVSPFCHVLDCCLEQETPMFLEGKFTEDQDFSQMSAIRLRGFCESVLEARFFRLLRRRRFDEAKSFAKRFKLSIEEVHKAKISWLAEELSPWKANDNKDKLFIEFKDTLKKIADLEFVARCSITAFMPTIDQTREILMLAARLVANNESALVSSNLLIEISKTLQKLETFCCCEKDHDPENWTAFARTTEKELCKKCLEAKNFDSFLLIWTRHWPDISKDLSELDILAFLELFSHEWPSSVQANFFQNFLPDCLGVCPECLAPISEWAIATVKSLEVTQRKMWPYNALTFSENFLHGLYFRNSYDELSGESFSKSQIILSQQRSDVNSSLYRFISLIDSLRTLKELHETHRIWIRLSEFLDDDKFRVVMALVWWCTEESDLVQLINCVLKRIIPQWRMNFDKTLRRCIIEIIDDSGFNWFWHIGKAPWEEKLSAILPFISNVEDKAEIILHAAKTAPVPWSEKLSRICKEGMTLNHHCAQLIRKQEAIVEEKLILRKYECTFWGLRGRSLTRLIQYMINEKGEEGYNDALKYMKNYSDAEKGTVHKVYLEHLLWRDDDSETAIRIVERLIDNNISDIFHIIQQIVTTSTLCLRVYETPLNESIIAFLMSCKLMALAGKFQNIETLQFCECVDDLKKKSIILAEFGILISEEMSKKKVIEVYIESQIKDFLNLPRIYKSVLRLANLLKYSHNEAFGHLVKRVIKAGRYEEAIVLSHSFNVSIDSVNQDRDCLQNMSSLVMEIDTQVTEDEWDEKELMRSLSAIMGKVVTACEVVDIERKITYSRWHELRCELSKAFHTNLSYNDMKGNNYPSSIWKFMISFNDPGLPLDREILQYFSRCLLWCADSKNANDESSYADFIENGANLLDCLRRSSRFELAKASQHLLLDTVMQKTSWKNDPNMHLRVWQRDKKTLTNLITAVISEKKPDFLFGLCVLSQEGKTDALKLLASVTSNLGYDYGRNERLALLGIIYCKVMKLLPQQKTFQSILQRSAWGVVVTSLGIRFREAFHGDLDKLSEVLNQLIFKPTFSVTNLSRYCLSFDMDVASQLHHFIWTTLLNLETYLHVDSVGVNVQTSKLNLVFEKVRQAIVLMEDKIQVKTMIFNIFKELNPYFYEVQSFLVETLESLAVSRDETINERDYELIDRANKVLHFFSSYKRLKSPNETEKALWVEKYGTSLPRISKFRLPTTLLILTLNPKARFKLLKNEFSLENHMKWSQISGVLNVIDDNICIEAVQNAVKELEFKNESDKDNDDFAWNLQASNLPLFEKIRTSIEGISKPMKAVTLGHWLMSSLPKGFDRVMAAEMTYNLALRHRKAISSLELDGALTHIQICLLQLRVTHILHTYDLFDPKYIAIMNEKGVPEMLQELYYHSSIIERSKVIAGYFPDINGAVQEIGEISNIDMTKVVFQLIDKWLPEEVPSNNLNGHIDLDETISNLSKLLKKPVNETSKNGSVENLIRCIYLCQSNYSKKALKHLYSVGFDERENPSLSMRALKCMLSVANEETVMEICKVGHDEVVERMKMLSFITRLQRLNMPFTLDTFSSANIEHLVSKLIKNSCSKTHEISLVVDLCLHYSIFGREVWSSLLKQMQDREMLSELERTLIHLNDQPHLWHLPAFISAWNSILQRSLAKSVGFVSENEDNRMDTAIMLRYCPIISELDLKALWQESKRIRHEKMIKVLEENFKAYMSLQ